MFFSRLALIYIFQKLKVKEDERSIVIDLRPYMNSAPYIVRLVSTSLYNFFHNYNINKINYEDR